jgi:hypothetical protein
MICTHCKTELVPHTDQNAKQDCLHCFGCGCCFLPDGRTVRYRSCGAEAQTLPSEPQPAAEDEDDDSDDSDEETPVRRRGRPRTRA